MMRVHQAPGLSQKEIQMTKLDKEYLDIKQHESFTKFLVSLSLFKPSKLARLELYLCRKDSPRADYVLKAGLANCGDEYYDY